MEQTEGAPQPSTKGTLQDRSDDLLRAGRACRERERERAAGPPWPHDQRCCSWIDPQTSDPCTVLYYSGRCWSMVHSIAYTTVMISVILQIRFRCHDTILVLIKMAQQLIVQ